MKEYYRIHHALVDFLVMNASGESAALTGNNLERAIGLAVYADMEYEL